MANLEGQETNTTNTESSTKNLVLDKTPMNKTKLLVLAVLVVAAILLVLANRNSSPKQGTEQKKQNEQSQNKKPQVPEEWVLGEKYGFDSQNEPGIQDFGEKTDAVFFNSNKTVDELHAFYEKKFINEGWSIYTNRQLKSGNYIIVAQKDGKQVEVTIFTEQSANSTSSEASMRSVGIVYKNL